MSSRSLKRGNRALFVPVAQPFPWTALLSYLQARLIPARERVEGATFIRNHEGSSIAVGYDPKQSCLRVDVTGKANPDCVEARVRHLFDPAHEAAALSGLERDPILGPRLASVPGLRPLGCWDAFELCVRTLIAQQVSVKAAQTLTRRVSERCGGLSAQHLAGADLDRIGMPTRRVAALRQLARAVAAGVVELTAEWSELAGQLDALPGFGPWTCQYLAIRLGRDPDAFPASDIGLIRAARAEDGRALERMAEAWRPLRAFAATYLWMEIPGDTVNNSGV